MPNEVPAQSPTGSNRPLRVVVADDQRVVRDGLVTILSTMDGVEVVGAAADGADAVALVTEHEADVALMDLRMPGTDGVEATRALRAARPATKVIVLTTYTDDESIVAAMAAGAVGYLTKNARVDDISQALRGAASGLATLDATVTASLARVASRHSDHERSSATSLPDGLTEREGQVLALAAQGLSNTEIAQRLYVSTSTVKTHINQIFAKTGSKSRPQAIAYAHRNGITGSDCPPND